MNSLVSLLLWSSWPDVGDFRPTPVRSQDDDFALAKILQEQERAFFHARSMYADG